MSEKLPLVSTMPFLTAAHKAAAEYETLLATCTIAAAYDSVDDFERDLKAWYGGNTPRATLRRLKANLLAGRPLPWRAQP